MHLIPGLPGEARRAGTGSVQRQKVCSQGLLVKHIPLPARPFHHNGLAECHSSSGKTWDSAFQRIWSSAGCGFSDGNAGGSGGADRGQACAHWAPCFRPTDLESSLPFQRPQQLKSRCPDMCFTCCLDLKSSCSSEPEPAQEQEALASRSKHWAGSQGGTQELAGEEGRGLARPTPPRRCKEQVQGSWLPRRQLGPPQAPRCTWHAHWRRGWLGRRSPSAGRPAATPSSPLGDSHLGPRLSPGLEGPASWRTSRDCQGRSAVDGHRAWARHPSSRFLLPAGWAGAGARVTVPASAAEGRACPGQQLGGGTVGSGPVAATVPSPVPPGGAPAEPAPSSPAAGPQKLSRTHGDRPRTGEL